jgi:hypothetical protein
LEATKAGKLEGKPFLSILSPLAFQPPSLQALVDFADSPTLVFQYLGENVSDAYFMAQIAL